MRGVVGRALKASLRSKTQANPRRCGHHVPQQYNTEPVGAVRLNLHSVDCWLSIGEGADQAGELGGRMSWP